MASDILYWKSQYRLLANACFEHNRAIEKVIDNNDNYLVSLRKRGSLEKEEGRFFKEMKLYQEILGNQKDKLKYDANEYMELEKTLKSFSDDPALRIAKLDGMYKLAKERLKAQTKIVEDMKKDYHKSMFGMEKADIKKMLATRNDVVEESKAKLEELDARATIQISMYTKHLDKWQLKFDKLQQLSVEFEESYLRREEARADKVLGLIQKSLELTNSAMHAKRDPVFNEISSRGILKEKVVKKDVIFSPTFEEYIKQEDTSEVYDRIRQEVEQEEDRLSQLTSRKHARAGSSKSGGKHTRAGSAKNGNADQDRESLEDRLETNKRLKMLRNEKLHLVTKAYKKEGVNQISLKIGEYVKQLLPENEDGLAFGEVIHGLLHKKKKGFYPVSHVTVLYQSEAERIKAGNGSEESKSAESTKPKRKTKSTPGDKQRSHDTELFDLSTDNAQNRKHRQRHRNIDDDDTTFSGEKSEKNIGDTFDEMEVECKKKQKKGVFGALKRRFKRKKSKASNDDEPEADFYADSDVIEQEPMVTSVQAYTPVVENDIDEAPSRKRKPKIAFQAVSDKEDNELEQANECNVNARRRRREKKKSDMDQ